MRPRNGLADTFPAGAPGSPDPPLRGRLPPIPAVEVAAKPPAAPRPPVRISPSASDTFWRTPFGRDAQAFICVSRIVDRHTSPEPWFRFLCALPWLALGSVYLEALLAALTLGYWPIPSLNDPKDLPTGPLHVLSTLLVLSLYPGVLVLCGVVIGGWSTLRRSSLHWLWLVLFLLGHLLVVAVGQVDPGRVLYWWMD